LRLLKFTAREREQGWGISKLRVGRKSGQWKGEKVKKYPRTTSK